MQARGTQRELVSQTLSNPATLHNPASNGMGENKFSQFYW